MKSCANKPARCCVLKAAHAPFNAAREMPRCSVSSHARPQQRCACTCMCSCSSCVGRGPAISYDLYRLLVLVLLIVWAVPNNPGQAQCEWLDNKVYSTVDLRCQVAGLGLAVQHLNQTAALELCILPTFQVKNALHLASTTRQEQ